MFHIPQGFHTKDIVMEGLNSQMDDTTVSELKKTERFLYI